MKTANKPETTHLHWGWGFGFILMGIVGVLECILTEPFAQNGIPLASFGVGIIGAMFLCFGIVLSIPDKYLKETKKSVESNAYNN